MMTHPTAAMMAGYKELLRVLNTTFGIEDKTWWKKVAFPPFENNLTTLWGQPYTWPK